MAVMSFRSVGLVWFVRVRSFVVRRQLIVDGLFVERTPSLSMENAKNGFVVYYVSN